MRKHLALTALLCLSATSSFAQTAVGTGVGVANSESASGAVAVNRGNGNSSSSLTVNNPANTTSTATVNSNVSGTTTSNVNSRVSGTQTVKSNPSLALGLTSAGLETCLGSASGGLSLAGFGAVGGSTYVDEGCQARLDSRTLFSYGLRAAAVARLCARPDMWRAMPAECEKYWPAGQPLPYGIVVAAPLVAPSGTYMSTSIRVINGDTGIEGDCLNYNSTKQKCLRWAAVNPAIRVAPAKPRAKKLATAPAVAAINAAAPAVANPE